MPINEALAAGTGVLSSTAYPVSTVSDAVVDGDFKGTIHLELLRPTSSEWMPVFSTTSRKSTPLNTPDPALSYRFRGNIISGIANVYFGP